MKTEHACGRLGLQTLDEITWRAASRLVELGRPWALCVEPCGRVTLERPAHAHPDDLLGVFDAADGLLATSRRIRDELAEHVRQHGIPQAPSRRVTVNSRRRAA